MAVRIRLKRIGAKKNPVYRIVVADSRSPRDGKVIEELGQYHPNKKDGNLVTIKEAETLTWLENGAKPTDTVRNILTKEGIWEKHKNKSGK